MCDASNIPNDYTPCECYRGYIIAICRGSYVIFDPNGVKFQGIYADRAICRQLIDTEESYL